MPAARLRRANLYVLVLATALLTTVIGLTAVNIVRLERRDAEQAADFAAARNYARSAIELGFLAISQDANWRQNKTSGAWFRGRSIGTGTCDLDGTDPNDGNLANSDGDMLRLVGVGHSGNARFKLQVLLAPEILPLDVLRTCASAGGNVTISSGKTLVVSGGPLSTNGKAQIDGALTGDLEAASRSGAGPVSGTSTVPATAKTMPPASAIAYYKSLATTIPFNGDFDDVVLTAGRNPFGATNPNGVYFIDTQQHDLRFRTTRFCGTLIIELQGRKLQLEGTNLVESYRADFPTLIVLGNLEVSLTSSSALSEAAEGCNYNPTGAPYRGFTDNDQADEYPVALNGLVHVTGNVSIVSNSTMRGVLIAEGKIDASSSATITHDHQLYDSPPAGYTRFGPVRPVSDSWAQCED